MAQPQGLNVGAIITTGIVGTLLIGATIEGVYAYYNLESAAETARKWEAVRVSTVETLKAEQLKSIREDTSIRIDDAMQRVVQSGGKLPSTQPAKG